MSLYDFNRSFDANKTLMGFCHKRQISVSSAVSLILIIY